MKSQYIQNQRFPESPGVYLMKNARGGILYVGKAGNLRRRVASYFMRGHEVRIEKLLREVNRISYKKTDTAVEALILEAKLIRRYSPAYNVREKDDKSFLYVEITKDKFPRVLLARGRDLQKDGRRPAPSKAERFGPFTSASSIREALRILRRIFPWSTHPSGEFPISNFQFSKRRPCFECQIGLCPGTCIGAISQKEYLKNIRNIRLFFEGKKKQIIRALEREMKTASKALEFEKAGKIRRQLFALQHIQDVAFIREDAGLAAGSWQLATHRIEGYDISNISGVSAVGSMVVFINNKPDKNEYRKFRIRMISQSDDVGMLKEILGRRLNHPEWRLPDLMLIDGGRGQVNAAKQVLRDRGFKISVVGIAKGPERKKNEFIGAIPRGVDPKTLVRVRDEAHRFAIQYHRARRSTESLGAPRTIGR